MCSRLRLVWALFALRSLNVQLACEDSHVFVAASREVDYQYVMRRHPWRNPHALGNRMGALERRENAFRPRKPDHSFQNMRVVGGDIFSATAIAKARLLPSGGAP